MPLGMVIEALWADLYDLVRDECDSPAWTAFRRWVEEDAVPYPPHEPSDMLIPTMQGMVEQFLRNLGDAEAQRARYVHRMISDYREKLRDPSRWGPVGFLVREVALGEAAVVISGTQGHPLPIVEDIAAAFRQRFHGDLLGKYLRATRPCLVKFYDIRLASGSLEAAARYFWRSVHRQPVHTLANFDGNGQPVPRNRVLEVQEILRS